MQPAFVTWHSIAAIHLNLDKLGFHLAHTNGFTLLLIVIIPSRILALAVSLLVIQIEFERRPAFNTLALPLPSKVERCELEPAAIECDERLERSGIRRIGLWLGRLAFWS